MLQTYPVGQPPQGERGADEVAELPGAVIGGGIVVNVIVNVLLVYMGTDEELIRQHHRVGRSHPQPLNQRNRRA